VLPPATGRNPPLPTTPAPQRLRRPIRRAVPSCPRPRRCPAPPLTGRDQPAAIASLTLAIASLVTFGLTTLPAIIAGHVALRQIRRTGQAGRPVAVAGLIMAYALTVVALWVIAVLVLWGLGGGDA